MIAETLAGIALVKSAVDGIKTAIGTANDIGDIANYVDKLFDGEKQVQQQRSKKSGVGVVDQFGVSNVARETIDARIAKEKMQEVATLIDLRFGPGTWKSIVEERARRIQEAKEAALAAKREAIKKHNELMDNIKIGVIIAGIVALGASLIIMVMVSVANALM
jgi:hypothetical protein